jgi:hypothetical protein
VASVVAEALVPGEIDVEAAQLWRRKAGPLDISARVSYEGRLVLVTSITIHGDLRR